MQKAFDLIVERLEEHLPPHSGWTKEVIEIVNQVAEEHEQEVCEWREDMTLSRSAIGHGKFESLMYVCKWKYCPYCGKKIKVVE